MTEDQDDLSDLFAQFDTTVQAGPPPQAPPSTSYTHSRAPSLWTRLVRWVVQGSGLLTIYLLFYLIALGVDTQSLILGTLGLGLLTFLGSPLLGRRPLAQPSRWAVVLLSITLLAFAVAVVAQWPVQIATRAPVQALALTVWATAQSATSPAVLLGSLIMASSLFWLGRRAAQANPWIETRPARRPWRRNFSLALGALALGFLLAIPLIWHGVRNQTWLREAQFPKQWTSDARSSSQNSSLIRLFPGADTTVTNKEIETAVNSWSQLTLEGATRTVKEELLKNRAWSYLDTRILRAMLDRVSEQKASPEWVEFVWPAYQRANEPSTNRDLAVVAQKSMRRQILPLLGQTQDTEVLALWRKRIAGLPPLAPVTRAQVDGAVLQALSNQRLPGSFTSQPFQLFGIDTSWTEAKVCRQAHRTWGLLIYSLRRDRFETIDHSLSKHLAPPYTGILALDDDLTTPLGAPLRDLPELELYPDRQILTATLDLKEQKARSGSFPATYQDLPYGVSYQGLGNTAWLFTEDHAIHNYRFLDVTLR